MGREELAKAHALLCSHPQVLEATIVSTCNRVEFYFVVKKQQSPFEVVASFYRELRGIDITSLEKSFYVRRNTHAVDHLFHVTAGLDSMVLGENQILGQVREAYSSACAVRAAGKVLHRLFHQAFRVGKQVRTDTEMGKGACSVSSASMELLKKKIAPLDKPTVLFVGINQMIALAASHLSKLECGAFLFANRTVEKAVRFAEKYEATGYPLTELPTLLAQADVVVCCTGSEQPVISRTMLKNLLAENPEKKLVIMDMAVPRDVETDGELSPNIDILDLEDVHAFVKQQQHKRELAIPQSEEIIERRLDEFMYWYDHVCHEPTYLSLEESFDEIRRQEIAPLLEKLPPSLREEVETVTRNLVEKLLKAKGQTETSSIKTELK